MTNRRRAVDFDPEHFRRLADAGRAFSPEEAFRHAHATNLWGGTESASGPGSTLAQTAAIAAAIPPLCRRLGVRTLLDLPCGEGHWMAAVALPGVRTIGADLLPEVVARAAAGNRQPDREFRRLDLLQDPLPSADLLLCRDCLVHLSFADLRRAIRSIRQSKITWLLATTFRDEAVNVDIVTGDWRPLNLERSPIGFPPPVELVVEGCTEQDGLFADKSLGLWRVADLPQGELSLGRPTE
jgi:hypothetical protein